MNTAFAVDIADISNILRYLLFVLCDIPVLIREIMGKVKFC